MRSFYIEPSTSNERKELFIEALLNNTDKVSKVSDHSVLSGLAYGVSKVAGKAEKDIAVYYSRIHPDYASGIDLDAAAALLGISSRLGISSSSVFLRIIAKPGTEYPQGTLEFKSQAGVTFFTDRPFVVRSQGFEYIFVRSFDQGEISNVSAYTINQALNPPVGHLSVTNETSAFGATDQESDDLLRKRIKENVNILSRGTLATLEQVMLQVNPNVYRLYHYGVGQNGKTTLAVLSQNGAFFTEQELVILNNACLEFLPLSDLNLAYKKSNPTNLVNVQVFPVDISLRVELDGSLEPELVRQQMQFKILSYFKTEPQRVEWDHLLELCKNTTGVGYISNEYFYPKVDIKVPDRQILRLRGFRLLTLKGSLINDSGQDLSAYSYPKVADFNFVNKILTT